MSDIESKVNVQYQKTLLKKEGVGEELVKALIGELEKDQPNPELIAGIMKSKKVAKT